MKSIRHRQKPRRTSHKRVFELVCGSSQQEISKIENFLQHMGEQLHLDDGLMHRLLVSCTEAVNNAIIHGNKFNPEKGVIIRCMSTQKTLTICVKDEGEGFDVESLQDPREEKNLMKENGRGVFLMRSLMDKVKFRKLKSGSVAEMQVKLH
jgi:serine/threonine-protein kinase RsbW